MASVPPAPALTLMMASLVVVRAREQQARAQALVVGLQRAELGLDAGIQLGVARALGQLGQLGEVIGPAAQAAPDGQLLAQPVRRAQDALRLAGVVPEVGL